jgi:hypothetical protein
VTAASGAIGTIGGSFVLNQGTGALNVRILSTNIGNSKIIAYNAATGSVGYFGTGSAAIILI